MTTDIGEYIQQARNFEDQSEFTRAVGLYERIVDLDPSNMGVQIHLSELYFKIKEYPKAIALFEKLLGHVDNQVPLLARLAYSYFKIGEFEKALEFINQAIELEPENYDSWHSQGTILQKIGMYDGALESYLHALSINSESYPSLYNAAVVNAKIGNMQEAIDLLKKCVKLNPEDQRPKEILDAFLNTTEKSRSSEQKSQEMPSHVEKTSYKISSELTVRLQEEVENEIDNIRKSNEIFLAVFGLFFGFLIATVTLHNFQGTIVLFFMMTSIGLGISLILEIAIANLLLKSIQELYRTWDIARIFYFLDELNVLFVFVSGMLWLFSVEFLSTVNLILFGGIITVEAALFYIRYTKTRREDPFNKPFVLQFRWLLDAMYNGLKRELSNKDHISEKSLEQLLKDQMEGLEGLDVNFIYKNIIKILYRINFLEKVLDPASKKEIFYLKNVIE